MTEFEVVVFVPTVRHIQADTLAEAQLEVRRLLAKETPTDTRPAPYLLSIHKLSHSVT